MKEKEEKGMEKQIKYGFTSINPKNHESYDIRHRERSGFTLVELIVVMAVIGILVLLAAPKFIGYTERAQETKHIHTAKVIETALEAYLINGGVFPDNLEVVDITLLNESVANKSIIGVGGYVSKVDDVYYELTYDFIKKLDVKLSANNELFVEALASSAPAAIYASEKGKSMVDKDKSLRGYTTSIEDGSVGDVDDDSPYEEVEYSEIDSLINEGYVPISTPGELNNVRNNLTGKYVQVNDINLSSINNFVPIRDFKGIYHGGGFAISNLNINRPTEDNVGLFGNTGSAIVKNVVIKNATITGNMYVGALMGTNGGQISRVKVEGVINGRSTVGGVVGQNPGRIELSSSEVEVASTGGVGSIGGLAGRSSGIVSTSFSKSTVVSVGQAAGGFIGVNSGKISNSYSISKVTSDSFNVGGFVGNNTPPSITKKSIIEKSFSMGSASSKSYNVGSFIGGNNAGDSYYNRSSATYRGTGVGVGAPIGRNGNLYMTDLKGVTTLLTPTVIDTAQLPVLDMKNPIKFANWDFENTWEILPGKDHPTLINNKEE